jgi:hypothetical protein
MNVGNTKQLIGFISVATAVTVVLTGCTSASTDTVPALPPAAVAPPKAVASPTAKAQPIPTNSDLAACKAFNDFYLENRNLIGEAIAQDGYLLGTLQTFSLEASVANLKMAAGLVDDSDLFSDAVATIDAFDTIGAYQSLSDTSAEDAKQGLMNVAADCAALGKPFVTTTPKKK